MMDIQGKLPGLKRFSWMYGLVLVIGLMAFDLLPIWFPGDPYGPGLVFRWSILVITSVYLIWRGIFQKARLPRTGFEVGVIVFALAVLASLAASPEPRQGMQVLVSYLRYLLLFYLLLDLLDTQLRRNSVMDALLLLSGILLVLAILETYAAYLGWWEAVGSRTSLPPFPYRFKSLVMHPNAMMSYLNLFAPIVFVRFLQAKRFTPRLLFGLWLGFFLLAIPFSSSRGGWLGIAGWLGLLGLLWVAKAGYMQRFVRLPRKVLAGLAASALVLAVLAGLGFIRFITVFAAHPTHGNDPFGGRAGLWLPAIQIWLRHPLFGAGVGRTGLEYLGAMPSIPPQYWPFHAHSLYLQVLTDFGVIGLCAFLFFIVMFGISLWRSGRPSEKAPDLLQLAVFAGLASWFVHGVFDDLTIWTAVMDQMMVLLAWTFTADHLRRMRRYSLNLVWLPLLLFTAWFGWSTWSAAPMRTAAWAANQADCQATTAMAELAHLRDPALRYYGDMTAITAAWAAASNPTQGGDNLLAKSIDALAYTAENKASPNLWLADLALIEWQAGQQEEAVTHLREAVARAPLESSFVLNLGVMLEVQGKDFESAAAYCQAINLRTELSEHPFWRTTPLRQDARNSCEFISSSVEPFWQQAQFALQEMDLAGARFHLAQSDWAREDALARKITHGLLLEAQGERGAAIADFEGALDLIAVPRLSTGGDFAVSYATYFQRPALPYDLVPTYVQLQQDVGQFDAMQILMEEYRNHGETDRLALVEQLYETAVHGGVIYPPVSLP